MTTDERIGALDRLGQYMLSAEPAWLQAKEKAGRQNSWFTPGFIGTATDHIARRFLKRSVLEQWIRPYAFPAVQPQQKKVGIVMAGNIPLVGFHDWLAVFLSGHTAVIKPSSKDETLITHLLHQLNEWAPQAGALTQIAEMVKGCDAYIATGSNNSAGYFEYYFAKYPHIIRKNRTSAAVLTGTETGEELAALADDVHLYFGLGCRNVTKLYVPSGYDFVPLLRAFDKYKFLSNHHKYKNNYDYNLAIHILNKQQYMSNDAVLLVENSQLFSPVSQLHYSFYESREGLLKELKQNQDIQCIVAEGYVPFGQSQFPAVNDFADGADTLRFLAAL